MVSLNMQRIFETSALTESLPICVMSTLLLSLLNESVGRVEEVGRAQFTPAGACGSWQWPVCFLTTATVGIHLQEQTSAW